MQYVGLAIAVGVLIFSCCYLYRRARPHISIVGVCALGVLFGLLLALPSSLLELTIPGFATIKQKAREDADIVKEIREEMTALAKESRAKVGEIEILVETLKNESAKMSTSISSAATQISVLETKVVDATNRIAVAMEEVRYLTNFAVAMGGGKSGFKELVALSRDDTSPYQVRAGYAWNAVAALHGFHPGIQFGKLPSSDLLEKFEVGSIEDLEKRYLALKSHERAGIIVAFGNSEKRSKRERAGFMAMVVENEEDLRACYAAMAFYTQLFSMPYLVVDFDTIIRKHWAENRDRI
ncbi:MAG: hypothetical protein IT581_03375 [Verrucomicrobiales bacterium]|nr:hypothetical protein [Verrucomicrobiales bacterium]